MTSPLPRLDPDHDYGIHVALSGGWGGGTTAVSLPVTVRAGTRGKLAADVGVGPGFNRGTPRRVRKLLKPDDLPGLRRRLRGNTLEVLVVADAVQGARTIRWPKRHDLPLAGRWRIDQAVKRLGPHKIDRATYRRNRWQCHVHGLPADYDAVFKYDVIVLESQDNVALGSTAQTMLVDYVRAGGGLVFLAGHNSFGKGRYAGSALVDVLPVTIHGPWDLSPTQTGRVEFVQDKLTAGLRWPGPPVVPWIQKVTPREGACVLARVDGTPGIVLGPCGQGRTVAVAVAPFSGDGTAKPFLFDGDAFVKLMSRLIGWAAGGKP